ncbi:MAG TPA: hypothetical protein VGM39_06330 [Kofleriaceae bacterium]|jgi:hypothetical protein
MKWLVVVMALGACGDDHHEDSGYGRNATLPAQLTCEALCDRLADCAVDLCNEDNASRDYDGLEGVLAEECVASCTDQRIASFTDLQQRCVFASSCRQVFDYDECNVDGNYTCN